MVYMDASSFDSLRLAGVSNCTLPLLPGSGWATFAGRPCGTCSRLERRLHGRRAASISYVPRRTCEAIVEGTSDDSQVTSRIKTRGVSGRIQHAPAGVSARQIAVGSTPTPVFEPSYQSAASSATTPASWHAVRSDGPVGLRGALTGDASRHHQALK